MVGGMLLLVEDLEQQLETVTPHGFSKTWIIGVLWLHRLAIF